MRRLMVPIERLITPPTREPLDVDEVKKYMKQGSTSEDTLYDTWISAAREDFETATDRQLMDATWELGLPAAPFESIIELPHPPLLEVVSVVYDDGDGNEQTVDAANYSVVLQSGPLAGRGWVSLGSGLTWPTTIGQPNSLRIRYRAGYGSTPADVPGLVKDALYMLIAHRDRNRSAVQDGTLTVVPMGAEAIIRRLQQSALPVLPPLTFAV